MATTIDAGIKLGASTLQIAWTQGRELQVAHFSGRPSLPASVAAGQDGRLAAVDPDLEDPRGAPGVLRCAPRLLGGTEPVGLPGSRRTYAPEEVMASLLRELLAARQPLRTSAAVVSVPAWCGDAQWVAFERAAAEVGLQHVLKLDQAVAAVEGARDGGPISDGPYLVFHLGGTSFDAALVQTTPVAMQVIDRESTHSISLQLIDEEIADYLALFAVRRAHSIPDFTPENLRYGSAFTRLRLEAQRIRSSFSRGRPAGRGLQVRIPGLLQTGEGRHVAVEYDLTRLEVEEIVKGVADQALARLRGLLARHAQPTHVIFSGGGCLDPVLRRRVTDALGIAEAPGIDPFTVLVRGAAAHAARMPLPPDLALGSDLEGTSRPAAYLVSPERPQLRLGETTTIGRMDYHTLVLADPRVSRDHVSIAWNDGQRSYVLRDVSSGDRGWGVFVNGALVPKSEARALADGDEIVIVDHTFRFVMD
ncbi:MAG: Hsp70 family protein [Chloroflexi bacterium]|nr:Hsp70 family protein [Chloroflexota bacterium]